MSSPSNSPDDLRRLLAFFFRSVEHEPARWLEIVNNGSSPYDCISRLLGLQYDKLYLPLMLQCGLIHRTKSNRHNVVTMNPSIESTVTNKYYTWSNFMTEHNLNIEVSYIIWNKKKTYFIRCGSFEQGTSRFTIWDQIRTSMKFKYNTLRDRQKEFIASLREVSLSLLVASPVIPPATETSISSERAESSSSNEIPPCLDSINNMKNIINIHFFEKVLKPGADLNKMWLLIDERKILSGIKDLISAVHKSMHDTQTKRLQQVDNSTDVTTIEANISKYPSICKFGVPLVNTAIKALLKDIVSLNEKTPDNLLTFEMFNGKPCNLINPVSSSSYRSFKQNVARTSWMDGLLSAVNDDKGVAAEWIMTYLGKRYDEKFTEVAVHLGLLLPPKIMDAESACAMWEEANCTYKSQRVILRHLKCFFGRRITVPENFIRELEDGCLYPISSETVIDGKNVFFWHKKIDEVVVHRIQLELEHRGSECLSQFDVLDVILGGDHGARRFRAAVKLIFRCKDQPEVKPISVILQVGHIDTAKDTYEILQQTIAPPLNEGMRRIINKFAAIHHAIGGNPIVTLVDERPDNNNNRGIVLQIRAFMAGDLAFYATVLGKPNMSPCWCTWCMLSKLQWNIEGHRAGPEWTVDKIIEIRNNVANGLAEKPETIFGCTHSPLFDAVPINNYIVSVLHIIIGIGNSLVDVLFDWVEWRIEKLTPAEITVRNSMMYAEVQLVQAKERYENWLDNEGVTLASKLAEKKKLQKELSAKVSFSTAT
jgi:hypothetical protein